MRVHRDENGQVGGIEVLLRETAWKGHPDPEDVDNPMIAPQDYDARQCGRVLGDLQNRDL